MNLKEMDMNQPFDDVLQLNVLTRGVLHRSGFCSIGYLANRTERELKSVAGLGKKGVAEIVQKLAEVGLMLPTGRDRKEEDENRKLIDKAFRLRRLKEWVDGICEQAFWRMSELSDPCEEYKFAVAVFRGDAEVLSNSIPVIGDGKVVAQ